MRKPTPEQQAVLENKARVRVVRAAPGSGKTWLVAEVIRQALDTWPTRTSGIAALSFTRVGGDEIRKAVSHELGHPHFVGTIDAFLFRYVIRPHLRKVFSWFADPRIVMGESGAKHWKYYAHKQKTTVDSSEGKSKNINLFGCVCIGEARGEAVMKHRLHPNRPLQPLTGDDLLRVKNAKMEIWKKHGLLTHSDAALWASKILEHPTLGAVVRAEVIRRFPFLIVDELQDTGHFLGKSIRLLLEEHTARSVLVGDPDQAIYEFTGARPDLFNTFEAIAGAVTLPLASSRRCPSAVVNAAIHVKDTGGVIGHHDSVGRALLVRYSDMVVDVSKVVEATQANRGTAKLKVIARTNATVEDIAGQQASAAPSLHCPVLTHMHRATVEFRQGRNTSALASARAAIELAVFQHEGVNDEEITAANIVPDDWKALAVRCILKANAIITTSTLFDWQAQAGVMLDEEISSFSLGASFTFVAGQLKPKKHKGWEKPSSNFLPQPNSGGQALAGIPVQTVHGVKGETHDVTVFVCPPTNDANCPSVVWWSTNDNDREVKRIAYVAMTRTRRDLIVCVSEDCYERLVAARTAFVESFECMTVAEYVISLGQCKQEVEVPDSAFSITK